MNMRIDEEMKEMLEKAREVFLEQNPKIRGGRFSNCFICKRALKYYIEH